MSAGAFERSRYQAEYGSTTQIHPIRVQPETAALTIEGVENTASTAPLTSPISAQVSKGKRTLGLHARTVAVRFTGALPAGYLANSIIRLPLLNSAIALAASTGAAGVYLGLPIVVVGFSGEVVR